MILVTVGSTHYDQLIMAVDALVERQPSLKDEVICQIGSGSYVPKNCNYFRYSDGFSDMLDRADLIITHGGTTVLHCIKTGKRFIGVANTSLADDHQSKMLRQCARYVDFPWTRDPAELGDILARLEEYSFSKNSTLNRDLIKAIVE